jgi:hypothetical protein
LLQVRQLLEQLQGFPSQALQLLQLLLLQLVLELLQSEP